MTLPHTILLAAKDPRLRSWDLAVYIILYAYLDIQTYRPLKQTWLARQVDAQQSHVSEAISRLTKTGYLEAGALDGASRTYRLTVSPIPANIPPVDTSNSADARPNSP